jgi:preprotein translocase subunit SecB
MSPGAPPRKSQEISGADILFPIQLRDVYLFELKTSRAETTKDSPKGPTLSPQVRRHELSENGRKLTVWLGATVQLPFRDGEAIATIECVSAGVFTAADALDAGPAQAFAAREGLVLLWPYLRAYIAQASTMMQLPFPPLPTLDVTRLAELAARAAQATSDRPAASQPTTPAPRKRASRSKVASSGR